MGQLSLSNLLTHWNLQLLWSPVVDSLYHNTFGRRKSWIVPMQAIMGCILLWIGSRSEKLLENVRVYNSISGGSRLIRVNRKAATDVKTLTIAFTSLVFFAATQGKFDFREIFPLVVIESQNSHRYCSRWYVES